MKTEYLLKLSQTQAEALNKACEVFLRLGLGQVDMAVDEVWQSKLFLGDKNEPVEKHLKRKDEVRYHCDQIKLLITGFTSGGSYGVGNPEVPPACHHAYNIHQVLRHELWKIKNADKKDKDTWSVNSSPAILNYTSEPFPEITSKEVS